MQPESSDGFASVGTILPEEGAALLPGGSFRFRGYFLSQVAAPLIEHFRAAQLRVNDHSANGQMFREGFVTRQLHLATFLFTTS